MLDKRLLTIIYMKKIFVLVAMVVFAVACVKDNAAPRPNKQETATLFLIPMMIDSGDTTSLVPVAMESYITWADPFSLYWKDASGKRLYDVETSPAYHYDTTFHILESISYKVPANIDLSLLPESNYKSKKTDNFPRLNVINTSFNRLSNNESRADTLYFTR